MINGKVYIIAEAGVNHNGDIQKAYELVDIAKRAGCDAVKFQTFKTENVISKNVQMADYQKVNLGSDVSQFDMVKKLELSYSDFSDIQQYCEHVGITFLSTADDEESLDFLIDNLNIPLIKIASSELTNYRFLKYVAKKNRPIILSTGMADIGEISAALNEINASNPNADVIILHCTTNYPTPFDEVNLTAMNTIGCTFKKTVGYSDHTVGIEVPVAAVALGAQVIEKHFTLDKNLEGPDHIASLDEDELTAMVKSIRNIEIALGDGIKQPNKSESDIKSVSRKKTVASKKLLAGTIICDDDIVYKRSDDGILSEESNIIIGRKLLEDVNEDNAITWDMFFKK